MELVVFFSFFCGDQVYCFFLWFNIVSFIGVGYCFDFCICFDWSNQFVCFCYVCFKGNIQVLSVFGNNKVNCIVGYYGYICFFIFFQWNSFLVSYFGFFSDSLFYFEVVIIIIQYFFCFFEVCRFGIGIYNYIDQVYIIMFSCFCEVIFCICGMVCFYFIQVFIGVVFEIGYIFICF